MVLMNLMSNHRAVPSQQRRVEVSQLKLHLENFLKQTRLTIKSLEKEQLLRMPCIATKRTKVSGNQTLGREFWAHLVLLVKTNEYSHGRLKEQMKGDINLAYLVSQSIDRLTGGGRKKNNIKLVLVPCGKKEVVDTNGKESLKTLIHRVYRFLRNRSADFLSKRFRSNA